MTWVTKKRYLTLSAKENEENFNKLCTQLQQKQACFPLIPICIHQRELEISVSNHSLSVTLTLLIFPCRVSRNIEIHTQMYPLWKSGSGFIAKCVTSALSNSIGIIRRFSPFPSDSLKHRVPRRRRIYLSESVALLLSISQAFSLICSLMAISSILPLKYKKKQVLKT